MLVESLRGSRTPDLRHEMMRRTEYQDRNTSEKVGVIFRVKLGLPAIVIGNAWKKCKGTIESPFRRIILRFETKMPFAANQSVITIVLQDLRQRGYVVTER